VCSSDLCTEPLVSSLEQQQQQQDDDADVQEAVSRKRTSLQTDDAGTTLQRHFTTSSTSPDGKTVTSSSIKSIQQQQESEKEGVITRRSSSSTTSVSQSRTTSSHSALHPVDDNSRMAALMIEGVDINTCTDDFKLNELLDNCNDYESRRQIRARIKTLLSGPESNGQNEKSQNSRTFGTSVLTKTEVVSRTTNVRTNRPQSAFSKFQQLDQSVKTTPR
jgi:hypothetical protein